MKNNNKSIIVVLYGPSCSGKDTLKDQLIKDIPNIKYLVPYTTREPREYEENRKDYFFIENDDVLDLDEKRIYVKINNNGEVTKVVYGYKLPDPDKKGEIYVAVTAYEGVEFFLQQSDKFTIIPVYLNTPLDIRVYRYLARENIDINNRCIINVFNKLREIVRRIEGEESIYTDDNINKLYDKFPDITFHKIPNGTGSYRSVGVLVTDLKHIIYDYMDAKMIMNSTCSILEKTNNIMKQDALIDECPIMNNFKSFGNGMSNILDLVNYVKGDNK